MFDALRRWRERRVLRDVGAPRRAVARRAARRCRSSRSTTPSDLARLRDLVVLFLDAKSIVGARGHDVTPLQRDDHRRAGVRARAEPRSRAVTTVSRTSSCIPANSCPDWEWEDEAGVVHRQRRRARRRGDARRSGGPVVARRRGVGRLGRRRDEPRHPRIRAQDRHARRRRQRLPAAAPMPPRGATGSALMRDAYDDFCARVDARRGHRDRSVRGGEPGRVLRRAVGSVFRRSAAAARRVSGRVPRVRAVLPAGPRVAGRLTREGGAILAYSCARSTDLRMVNP